MSSMASWVLAAAQGGDAVETAPSDWFFMALTMGAGAAVIFALYRIAPKTSVGLGSGTLLVGTVGSAAVGVVFVVVGIASWLGSL